MRYLAQVKTTESPASGELLMLAQQNADQTWIVLGQVIAVPVADVGNFTSGMLVLVEVDEEQQILNLQDAKYWLLDVIEEFLATNLSPAFLQQEAERAEQWRQDLTLQSQDLARRTMELEARQEQIQTLEAELKEEREKLEAMAAQLMEKTE